MKQINTFLPIILPWIKIKRGAKTLKTVVKALQKKKSQTNRKTIIQGKKKKAYCKVKQT